MLGERSLDLRGVNTTGGTWRVVHFHIYTEYLVSPCPGPDTALSTGDTAVTKAKSLS